MPAGVVVRLKGGDPFVFGRGGEEALQLREAGVPFEVVPGITAGLAAPAYAGIPVTHRGLSTAVALVTGHTREDSGETALDWEALAAFPGTLVFYMGVSALPAIAAGLLAAGRPADEPAAVIEAGTLPRQRTVTGTLATIADRARRRGGASAVGDRGRGGRRAGPRARLAAGRARSPAATVAVTRARAQASGLARDARASSARGSCRRRRSPCARSRARRSTPRRTT